MTDGPVWEQFAHDPRDPAYAGLRASDRDRAVLHDLISQAFAEGRLTREEFDERSQEIVDARTLAELPPLIGDLIPTGAPLARRPDGRHRREAEQRYRSQRSGALASFLVPTLICWAIWLSVLLGGHGTPFPWPLFVTIGTGANFFRLISDKQGSIASIERDLTRKEERSLERKLRRELDSGPS